MKKRLHTVDNSHSRSSGIERRASRHSVSRSPGFTLLELLTVIAIIAILIGLLFPAVRSVKEHGKRSQAEGDVHRIVIATTNFYTEYGKYPALPATSDQTSTGDIAVGDAGIGLKIPNRELFYSLRSIDRGINIGNVVNPRKVVFIESRSVADPDHPHGGFLENPTNGRHQNELDCFFDPWERQYCVAIDYNYDGQIDVEYADFSGAKAPRVGVGAFSLGPDNSLGASSNLSYVKGSTQSDDVISW
jgi:prepilin-type N-terminal cleavage/methylation domain-containing protein